MENIFYNMDITNTYAENSVGYVCGLYLSVNDYFSVIYNNNNNNNNNRLYFAIVHVREPDGSSAP